MSLSTVFNESVLRTKKKNKIKLLFLALGRIIKNNPILFFFCSLLAIITALVNFNIGLNFRNFLTIKEKTLSEQVIKEIEKEGGEKETEIEKKRIRETLEKKVDESDKKQKKVKEKITEQAEGEGSLKKKEIKELIENARVG
jgi:flagellar hook-basal body complex protein FliE